MTAEDDGVVHELAQQTIYFYTESLTFGKFIFQSMPRLLTLGSSLSRKATNTSTLSSVKRSFRAAFSSYVPRERQIVSTYRATGQIE